MNEEEPDNNIGPYRNQQHNDIVGEQFFGGVKIGNRIRLDSTKDPFTKLKRGDTGTVQEFWTDDLKGSDGRHIWRMRVKWDNTASNLTLLHNVDKFTKIEDMNEQKEEVVSLPRSGRPVNINTKSSKKA
jgi:hypothetical protein